MERLLCENCGSNLTKKDDSYLCPCCNAIYQENAALSTADALRSVLEDYELERWAKAKSNLYRSTHVKYPSKEAVVTNAREVLSIQPKDFMARIYLSSHDEDPYELNRLLAENSVSKKEAEETLVWLLPSLHPSSIAPLKDFVMRHFYDKERTDALTKIEEEANKLDEGIYLPGLPRDVFLAYSSADMVRVIETVEILEENGFDVWMAARNLRHGKGSAEHYLPDIYTAMTTCKVFVFLSSRHSRTPNCDAFSVEIAHLIKELPNKPRIEYVIEDYTDRTPYRVIKTMKEAFPTQEHCRTINDLIDRIESCLEEASQPKQIDEETIRRELEEKLRKEVEAKAKAEIEAKYQAELKKKEETHKARIEELKKQAEEAAKKEQERKALEEKSKKQAESALKDLRCPMCGGNRFKKTADGYECLYCGHTLYRDQPTVLKKEAAVQEKPHAELTKDGVIVLRKKKKR